MGGEMALNGWFYWNKRVFSFENLNQELILILLPVRQSYSGSYCAQFHTGLATDPALLR
jgi:hypothetical protein